jgi:tetratricopeptide (TPR) repeat protein
MMVFNLSLRPATLVLCCFLLLSGCGHVEEARSARQEQATDFNQRAQRAFLRGDYQVAATLYENALRLDVAIENMNGIAINTLNLARVNQVLGRDDVAQQYLDRLLEDKALHYAPAQLAAAAAQRSLLGLKQGDDAGAAAWADKAAAYCGSDCPLVGVIDNARANIALRANDADKTLYWGERAASENKSTSPLEYANSLRLTASARMLKSEHEAALRLAEEALAIDKSLGLPDKIHQDLLLAGQAHQGLGHADQAAEYRDRAARIAATGVK